VPLYFLQEHQPFAPAFVIRDGNVIAAASGSGTVQMGSVTFSEDQAKDGRIEVRFPKEFQSTPRVSLAFSLLDTQVRKRQR
jgi:hypothetical protein